MAWIPLALILAGCGGQEDRVPAKNTGDLGSSSQAPVASSQVQSGRQTFVVVAAQSKASYLANEEFFAGALKKLGITAGKRTVVGSTQAIDGQFQLDPKQPTAGLGNNTFTVRLDTLTTDQPRRDQYIRDDGPRFADYPLATFKATAIAAAAGAPGNELHVTLMGDMTIRQITRPATFDVKAQLTGNTLAGIATTRLLMSNYGIEPLDFYNTLTVADEVGLEVRFVARAR